MQSISKQLGLLLATIVMIGAGCTQSVVSSISDQKATDSLSFSSGDELVLRETFLGLGGQVVDLLGGVSTERRVKAGTWNADVLIDLSWSMTSEQETQASIDARSAYDAKYKHTPVGTPIPEPPKQDIQKTETTGLIRATELIDATNILLPHLWVEGEQVTQKNSLLWLTRKQYQALTQTRETRINLGLFDDSLAYAQALSDRAKDLANWLTQSKEQEKREDVLKIVARPDWSAFTLNVNGKSVVVRTIEAQNSFARYTILANENNPLILEVVLSPLSRGSINLFNKKNLFESFVGYEVISITQNVASSARPPQP